MSAVDWICLAVLLASLLLGAWRGLVYEVLAVAGWVIAFLAARWSADVVGQWLPIAGSELSRLGASNPNPASRRLGIGVVVGRQVWDRQHKVRLYLGPLTLAQYRSFLPSGGTRPALRAWMKQLLGDELEWDAELILRKDQVPPTRLGGDRGSRLGWTSWLGERARTRDAADLRVPSSYGAGGAEQRFEPALAGSS